MKRRAFIGATGGALLATTGIANAQFQPNGFARQYTIGVSLPFTGEFASIGNALAAGVQAACDESNRFGPPSQFFAIRRFDDGNQVALAIGNAQLAASDPSVVGVVGDLSLDVTLQAAPQYANLGLPLLVPTITDDTLTERGFRNIFRLPAKDFSQGQLMAQILLRVHAPPRTLVIAPATGYGVDVARGFVAQAGADHHSTASATLDKGNLTLDERTKAALGSGPQLVVLCGLVADLGPVAVAMRAKGYTGVFACAEGFYTTQTLTQFGKALGAASVMTTMPPLNRAPSIAQQLIDLRRTVGAIDSYNAFAYAAAQILIQGVGRTGSYTRPAMLSLLQFGGSFDTLVGSYSFNFSGDPTLPNLYAYRIEKGAFVYDRAAFLNGFIL
ncbi:MAG TPA: branched-chain amino acid ABC transporter substrate-binding protein [Candidatus Dormibacteraeota bacterium]|nr:branched-chain amino acid ABC transporter substrate-binding protein [Candidatus Dormibacteraeota bacterium]